MFLNLSCCYISIPNLTPGKGIVTLTIYTSARPPQPHLCTIRSLAKPPLERDQISSVGRCAKHYYWSRCSSVVVLLELIYRSVSKYMVGKSMVYTAGAELDWHTH